MIVMCPRFCCVVWERNVTRNCSCFIPTYIGNLSLSHQILFKTFFCQPDYPIWDGHTYIHMHVYRYVCIPSCIFIIITDSNQVVKLKTKRKMKGQKKRRREDYKHVILSSLSSSPIQKKYKNVLVCLLRLLSIR